MIARVKNTIKIKKTKIIKEKRVRTVVKQRAVFREVKIPPKYYCVRCEQEYNYGDNPNQPDKCPRCVCVNSRCNHDSIMHRPLFINGTSVYRCLYCWFLEEKGRVVYGKGYNYQEHTPPVTAEKIEKRAFQENFETTEEYEEEVEVEYFELVDKVINVDNIDYADNNKIVNNEFKNYREFIKKYLEFDKYFSESDLSKYEKWYGSKSHNHVLELLKLGHQKEKVSITSLAALEYNQLIVGEKQLLEEFPSVVGFYPNVPAYIQGHPLNMYNNKRVNKLDIEKSINIYFNATMDSKNFDSQYRNRGIICYSLIDYLIHEEGVKVNLKLLDISFVKGETCIQTIDFDYETIKNDLETVYNFLTVSAVLRVMMLEYKASLVKNQKLNEIWLDGFGYFVEEKITRQLLSLNDNDILFGTPDELKISGFDIEDDFINCMDSLGLSNSYYVESEMNYQFRSKEDSKIDIQKTIQNLGITKLIHFTSEDNIKSIEEHGILPRKSLIDSKIDFDYNDEQRLDNNLDAICLSVQIPNQHLLDEFVKRYPDKKYKILEINPSILYDVKKDNQFVKRIFCDYNAASRYAQKSDCDINIMFQDTIKKRHIIHNRISKNENEPTSDQAEILFFGQIPTEYIMNLENTYSYSDLKTDESNNEEIKYTINNSVHQIESAINEIHKVKVVRKDNKVLVVNTYNGNLLNEIKISNSELEQRILNKEDIYVEIGSGYSYKELVGKHVLLTRVGYTTNNDIRLYFNTDNEVAIGIKNVKAYFVLRKMNSN